LSARRAEPAAVLERTVPHDLDAERTLLGALLINNATFELVAPIVRSHDFFRDAHRRIFEHIAKLLDAPNGYTDIVLLKNALRRAGELEEVGGVGYLGQLTDGVPRSTNAAHYARIVREKAQLRGVIHLANAMLDSAYDDSESPGEVLANADRGLIQLQHGFTASAMLPVKQTSPRLLDDLERRVQNQGQLTGVETGFPSINALTFGWQQGDVIVVAARPSIGKTTFVMNSAAAAAESERRPHVAVFSMEMKREQLEYRLLSSLSGVPLSALLGGYVKDEHWPRITQALGRMGEMNLHIDDTPGRTVWDIRGDCRRMRAEHGLDVVIIDYIQLMPGTIERRGATRNDEVTDISRRLKVLAGELRVPIVVLSQLNRAAEGRSDPRPKLSDLRESGALEQDADLVCFLHRAHHRESGTTEFILEKQRNGPTGTVYLTLDRETVTFADGSAGGTLADQPPPPKPKTDEEKQAERVRAIIRNRKRSS
jgi:replicative DNA helicase